MKNLKKYLLVFVLLIAIFSRFYFLTEIPHGFFCDEASIGYNAFKILKTGKDQNGFLFPFYFKSFDHYRNPVTVYLNVLPTLIFGLSEFSVRFLAALSGVLTVILIFLIGRKIEGYWTGFFASLFLATSPWHIHMSRIGWECIYFPLSVCLGIFFWQKKQNNLFWYLSILAFGIGIYTYYPAWLLIPLFVAGLLAFSFKKLWKEKKKLAGGILLFVLLLVPLFLGFRSGKVLVRWQQVNRPEETAYQRVNNGIAIYFKHFGFDFLFKSGDAGLFGHLITRHSVKGIGEVYLYQLPLLVLGIMAIFFKMFPGSGFILLLLFLYPLGSSLTDSGIYATRSILGVIPFSLAPALGVVWLEKKIFYKVRKIFFGLIIVCSIGFWIYFLNIYFKKYSLYSSDYWGWQYGPREIISYFMDNYDSYDELFLEDKFNGPEIFAPFYSRDKCKKCFVGGLEKINFSKKQLFAVSPKSVDGFSNKDEVLFEIKSKVLYPDRSTAFIIVEPKWKNKTKR